jgi:hypothetical protein
MPRATYCDAVDWSLLRVKQTPSGRGESVVLDPKRHFATAKCRIAKGLFDHLVGECKQRRRDGQAERLGGLEVDHELEFGARLVPGRLSCVNAGHEADAPVPPICSPYKGSVLLSRAREHLLLSFYTLPLSANTVACIYER